MQWYEFGPYVLPYVIGCPEPTLTHHARLAAIEFCRRTACWQTTLDFVTTDGTTSLLEMESDTGVQINKVHAVSVGGKEWPLVNSKLGLSLVRAESTQDFCFTQDNKTLQIYPIQDAGTAVIVDATLVPTLAATTLSDDVALTYAQDIAHGVIASIQSIPKQDFTDLPSSATRSIQFNSRISTVAAKIARGMMGVKMRAFTTFL